MGWPVKMSKQKATSGRVCGWLVVAQPAKVLVLGAKVKSVPATGRDAAVVGWLGSGWSAAVGLEESWGKAGVTDESKAKGIPICKNMRKNRERRFAFGMAILLREVSFVGSSSQEARARPN